MTATPALWDEATADQADVIVDFAGAGDDEPSLALCRKTTHDQVLAELARRGVRQAGPVEWRIFPPSEAAGALADAGLAEHANAPGLIEFLSQPDVVLVITTVAYLRP